MSCGRRARCIVAIAMAVTAVAVMAALRLAPAARFRSGASADLAAGNGTCVIGRCTTELNPDQRSRNDNIAIAAEKLDGTMVGPGQEFSFNEAVG